MSERGQGQGRVSVPLWVSLHSSLSHHSAPPLHSGPPASWLQPTLAIPLQDLSCIELGLAGQSLRLEWAAGAGSCVLLPRDAKHCRAFLEALTGERGKREERRGREGRPRVIGPPTAETHGEWNSTLREVPGT